MLQLSKVAEVVAVARSDRHRNPVPLVAALT